MEDYIEGPGTPFLDSEEMFCRKRAWEEEAGAGRGRPGEVLVVDGKRAVDKLGVCNLSSNLCNLSSSYVHSPDWTKSIHV